MSDLREESKRLASLAVFRELYNSKKDVYGVISEFLNDLITNKNMHQFHVTEITDQLNSIYDFEIPEAVVSTSLKRLDYVKKEHGKFIANPLPSSRENTIGSIQKDITIFKNNIIENLFRFIEQQKKNKLSDSEKILIVNSFCAFILDDSNGKGYSEFISAFLINNKEDASFRKNINKIREGIILYSGLSYNNNLSQVGSWKTELSIYLDTEILFHYAGFNGELYKSLFFDFFKYVKEINANASKRLIKLLYFKEVEDEIVAFFNTAKHILEGKVQLNPKSTAMVSILNGCKDPSDVMDKQADFFLSLNNGGIKLEDSCDYYTDENQEYNIIDQDTIEKISNDFQSDILAPLCYLNYIHIHRNKSNYNNFYNIKAILLTGKHMTLNLSWHREIKPDGAVPLSTNLEWITNKFWYKLNKGFGGGDLPKNFDILTKAQLLLSSILNKTVGDRFEELQHKYKNGDITEDQIKARIINLRDKVRNPEDIDENDIPAILDVITEDSLDDFIAEQEHLRVKARKQKDKYNKLKVDLLKKEKIIDESERTKSNLAYNNLTLKNNLLKQKQKSLDLLESQKTLIEKEIDSTFGRFKIRIIIAIFSYYLCFFFLIWKFGWDKIEPWTWIINGIFLLSSFIFMIVHEKTMNPLKFLKKKRKAIQDKKYNQFNFDNEELKEIKISIEELTIEIKS